MRSSGFLRSVAFVAGILDRCRLWRREYRAPTSVERAASSPPICSCSSPKPPMRRIGRSWPSSDDVAAAAAREAEQAKLAVQKDVEALQAILTELDYTKETGLLQTFEPRFEEYRKLDRQILDLVVEQTNLRAQRLAFGPVTEAADIMRAALDTLAPAAAGNAWQVKALAATTVASVREIQAIQGPHIADTDDAAMDEKETAHGRRGSRGAARARRADAPRHGRRPHPTCQGPRRIRSVHGAQRRARDALAPQYERAVARVVTQREAEAHRSVRGEFAVASRRTGRAGYPAGRVPRG